MKKKTVFISGIGQLNYINPIVKAISKFSKERFAFSISSYKKLVEISEIDSQGALNFIEPKIRVRNKIHSFFYVLKPIYIRFLIVTLFRGGFNEFRKNLSDIIKQITNYIVTPIHDIYHVHFVTLANTLFFPMLKTEQKLILTYWGSDLLRNDSFLNNYWISKALNRANVITCQSVSMKGIILEKFNLDLDHKIEVVQFILNKNIFNTIDKIKDTDDKQNNDIIKKNSINILVGHNASTENRHKEIIKSLYSLPEIYKQKLNLIFVFGYGIKNLEFKKFYKELLIDELEKAKLNYRFIDELLPAQEIAYVRVSSKICIHVPVSDALSAAITESMYAGNFVVTGSWLPYSPFKNADIYYKELDNPMKIAESVIDYIDNEIEHIEKLKLNKLKVKEQFLSDSIEKEWYEVFKNI